MITIKTRIVRIIAEDTAKVSRDLMRLVSNPLGQTTVARAARKLGADAGWLKQWASALGGRASRAYQKAHGTKPRKAWEADRQGKIVEHYAYAIDSPELLEALEHYSAKTGLA